MNINWKVRFKNKVWLTAFVMFIISTVYNALGMFDVAPAITQDNVVQIVTYAIQLLTLFGIVVDPTTAGLSDSARAMSYQEPRADEVKKTGF